MNHGKCSASEPHQLRKFQRKYGNKVSKIARFIASSRAQLGRWPWLASEAVLGIIAVTIQKFLSLFLAYSDDFNSEVLKYSCKYTT